jgi:hypothetical protein
MELRQATINLRKKLRDLFTAGVDGRHSSFDTLKGRANDSKVLFNRLDASTVIYYRKSIQDFICTALNNIKGGMSFPGKVILFAFLCTSRVT